MMKKYTINYLYPNTEPIHCGPVSLNVFPFCSFCFLPYCSVWWVIQQNWTCHLSLWMFSLSSHSGTQSSAREIAVVYLCLWFSRDRFVELREKSGPPFEKATDVSESNQLLAFIFNQEGVFFFLWEKLKEYGKIHVKCYTMQCSQCNTSSTCFILDFTTVGHSSAWIPNGCVCFI